MHENSKKWLNWISEIQAISQSGLTFTKDKFDQERYYRLTELAAELAEQSTTNPYDEIHDHFTVQKGYATPKIDVRSFVLNDNDKLLLVKERADGLWTLPGGYADVNESPAEAAQRETQEESGYTVTAVKLLALWDKLKHDHPLQWPHVYKLMFHCKLISGSAKTNIEIAEINFFDINELPPLSTPRVTERQLRRLYELVKNPGPTLFD